MKLSAYIIIFCLTFASCNSKKKEDFKLPSTENIYSVTKTIIHDDSLGLVKENSTIPICNELRKLELTKEHYFYNQGSKKFIALSISNLTKDPESPVKNFFTEVDTSFIKFQLRNMKMLTISSEVIGNLKSNKLNEDLENGYFYLSIPIFSSDLRKAYVQLTWMYSAPSQGDEIYLEKKNGCWKIIKRKTGWAR